MGFSMSQLGSMMGTIMFLCTFMNNCVPDRVWSFFETWHNKLMAFLFPYIEIAFHERAGDSFGVRGRAYTAIETYLENTSSERAMRLKAAHVRGRRTLALSMDDYEDIIDVFDGIKVTWTLMKRLPSSQIITTTCGSSAEKRYYLLTFHRKHREIITKKYLQYVLDEGKAIEKKNRTLKLYTNLGGEDESSWEDNSLWSHVLFEHPATFQTLAMEPSKKKEIMDDLITFSTSKEYYNEIGKPWKRGYLLYGPPGTGKSTMIAAMANLLQYDIYDLELTSVDDNMELRRLLIEIGEKSIIVIEDIDCSSDVTGKRQEKKAKKSGSDEKEVEDIIKEKPKDAKDDSKTKKVTLSGLLNFIDGLWSSCGGERIIVFTTNHVDKLDPALIRRGRMDKHIELSYCCFEAFKVLAKNYLGLEEHDLFPEIESLLLETKMTPADVAENLMPKSLGDNAKMTPADVAENAMPKSPGDDAKTTPANGHENSPPKSRRVDAKTGLTCLHNLIKALETAKEKQGDEDSSSRSHEDEDSSSRSHENENTSSTSEEDDDSSSRRADESNEQ